MIKFLKARALGASVAVFAALPAFAQESSIIDATEIASDIADVGTSIATIGSAIIALAVIALSIRWIKATFFA